MFAGTRTPLPVIDRQDCAPIVSTLSADTSGEIQTQIIHYIGKLTFFARPSRSGLN